MGCLRLDEARGTVLVDCGCTVPRTCAINCLVANNEEKDSARCRYTTPQCGKRDGLYWGTLDKERPEGGVLA